jgi:hypothetical protein
LAEAIAVLGIIMLAISTALYDQTTYFPGAAAMLPCLGTAFLIHSGSDQATRTKAILSWPPIVTVGLMSYSLYLYHFPVHVYAERLLLRDLDAVEILAAIGLTFILGFLSWRYVEKPFRQRGRFDRRQIFAFGALGSLAVAVPAGVTVYANGFPYRFSPAERALFAAENDYSAEGRQCINMPIAAAATAPACQLGAGPHGPRKPYGDFLIVGDSHAAALTPALRLAAENAGQSGTMLAFNACAPFVDVEAPALSWRDASECRRRSKKWIQLAQRGDIQTVLLTAYWSGHLKAWNSEQGNGEQYMAESLRRTLNQLAGKRVVILLDVPHSSQSPGLEAVFAPRFGQPPGKVESSGNDKAAQIIRRVAAGRAEVIDLSAPFCTEGSCRVVDRQGRPILSDSNHITANAARESLATVLTKTLAGSQSHKDNRVPTGIGDSAP